MTAPAIVPPALSAPAADQYAVLNVRAHEVERGDIIVGFRSPVESILFHGNDARWYYADRFGTIICRRHRFATLQVLRGGLSADDTPPHGIERTVA